MKASYLKRYPLSHAVIAIVIVLSLAPIPEVPHLPNISLLDKWVHFVMYGGIGSVIGWEYLRQHHTVSRKRLAIVVVLLPAILGGLLELAQKYLTTCRSGEWLDFVANCIGALTAAAIVAVLSRFYKG